jgi:hypothetical protein
MTPSGLRGWLNDAVSIYFLDATLASAFIARWCAASRIETDGGVFRLRYDEPARIRAGLNRTPLKSRLASESPRRKIVGKSDPKTPLAHAIYRGSEGSKLCLNAPVSGRGARRIIED